MASGQDVPSPPEEESEPDRPGTVPPNGQGTSPPPGGSRGNGSGHPEAATANGPQDPGEKSGTVLGQRPSPGRGLELLPGGPPVPVAVTMEGERRPIPWKTIWAAIASLSATYAGYRLILAVANVLAWVVVALFFAVIMTPPVDYLQHRLKVRRGLATLSVFLVMLMLVGAMMSAFIYPLVNQSTKFADNLPEYVEDARNGEGAVGDLVERFELEEWVDENQDKIRDTISNFGAPAIDVVRRVFATIFAAITIVVLTILMVLESPKFSATILGMLPDRHRERVRGVAVDSCRAVSGYVFGNLLISVIAGLSAYTTLKLLGVPYAEVLGLFVAFSDLIPLVGATLGAVPSTLFAFLHSVTAGVVALIFFIVYQQFENHVLQVTIMSRTVKLNALTVFISVLVGIELLGILGALLAIPVAGVIQVITRDFWDERKGRPTSQPTVGVDHVPVTEPGK